MKTGKKKEKIVTPTSCDCSPEDFKPRGQVNVGKNGLFQFCDKCKRERRLEQKI